MLSQATKRLRRVERRGLPETVQAYRQGLISLRKADQLLYLSPARQRMELARILSAAAQRQRTSRLVADTIRGYLDNLGNRRLDLNELNRILKEALSSNVATATIQ
jgi:hypothetical protein